MIRLIQDFLEEQKEQTLPQQEKYVVSYQVIGAQDNFQIYETQEIGFKFVIKNRKDELWKRGDLEVTIKDSTNQQLLKTLVNEAEITSQNYWLTEEFKARAPTKTTET